jgi:hypothetical protein
LDIYNPHHGWIIREAASILSKLPHLQALAMSAEDMRIPQLLQQYFISTQFVAYNSNRKGPPPRKVLLQNVTDLSLDHNFQFMIECCPNVKRLSAMDGSQLLTLLHGLKTHPNLNSFTLHTSVTLVSLSGEHSSNPPGQCP